MHQLSFNNNNNQKKLPLVVLNNLILDFLLKQKIQVNYQ